MIQLNKRSYTHKPQDGTSAWTRIPDGTDCELPDGMYKAICDIVVNQLAYPVEFVSDDQALVDGAIRYHEQNNQLLPPATGRHAQPITIFYSTTDDIVSGELTLAAQDSPYVAAASRDGHTVLASGKVSVGTLKSIAFGIVTSVACYGTRYVPLHASIGYVPQTDDIQSAIAISGRGNWGKTTNMVSVKIKNPQLQVVTDDWSLIDVDTREIVPVDMMVAIRPEAVEGIEAAIAPENPPAYLREAEKDSGRLYSVADIFGAPTSTKIRLDEILLTDKRESKCDNLSVYTTDGLDALWRIQDDAYHSPDIDDDYQDKYRCLVEQVQVSAISTVVALPNRQSQLENISKHIVRK